MQLFVKNRVFASFYIRNTPEAFANSFLSSSVDSCSYAWRQQHEWTRRYQSYLPTAFEVSERIRIIKIVSYEFNAIQASKIANSIQQLSNSDHKTNKRIAVLRPKLKQTNKRDKVCMPKCARHIYQNAWKCLRQMHFSIVYLITTAVCHLSHDEGKCLECAMIYVCKLI